MHRIVPTEIRNPGHDDSREILLKVLYQAAALSVPQTEYSVSHPRGPALACASRATEVWRIFNTTGDTHLMHFHLVKVQVLSRQLFNVAGCDGVSGIHPSRSLTGFEGIGTAGNGTHESRRVYYHHHAVLCAQHSQFCASEPANRRV
jgi:hypothetical protein